MNSSPAFQFYPADFLADENVIIMTPLQRGAYIFLICHAWRSTTVGRLLNDAQRLATLAGLSLVEWQANREPILRAFRIDDDGFITQKRLVKEWEKQQVRHAQTVAAGKVSAAKRSQTRTMFVERPFNDRSTTVQRTGNPSSSSSSSVQIPLTLQGEVFLKAWERWKDYRKEIKHPLKPKTQEAQLNQFEKWGVDRSVQAINHTILKGYQGILEPTPYGPNGHQIKTSNDPYAGLTEEQKMRRIVEDAQQ